MPIVHRVDRALGVVFATATGVLTDDDLFEFAQKTANDPEFRSGLHELIDLRAADATLVTTRGLRRVAEIFGAFDGGPSHARIAFVAPADVVFGLSRMYQAFRADSPAEIGVFRELPEARAWLGLPADVEGDAAEDPRRS
jgi:hypothetical protein